MKRCGEEKSSSTHPLMCRQIYIKDGGSVQLRRVDVDIVVYLETPHISEAPKGIVAEGKGLSTASHNLVCGFWRETWPGQLLTESHQMSRVL